MNILTSKQHVPAPLEEVFAFFGQPENLARITPPWLGFQVLTPSPVAMEKGALIDYQISLGNAVNVDNISAEFDKGVLTIALPKSEKSLPRKIEVK